MKIKITEEQYNTLLSESFIDRTVANTKSFFTSKEKNKPKSNEDVGKENFKYLQDGVINVNNKIKSFINDIDKLFPMRNKNVDEYLYFLVKLTDLNNFYLNLGRENYVTVPKAKSYTDSESTKKDDVKLKYIASRVRDYVRNVINNLNGKFKNKMDRGGNIDGFKFIGVENYIYFLGEFLNENKIKGKLDSDKFGYSTRFFFNDKSIQNNPKSVENKVQPTQTKPQQTQVQQTQTKPQQTQVQPTKTNYPNRSEELRQKMQSRLNPNPYYGK